MNTRMELWKNYRKEIDSNINLQRTLENSDDSFRILSKRLTGVFPDYPEKYHKTKLWVKVNTYEIDSPQQISNDNVQKILEEISDENIKINFENINELDFSSHQLKSITESIRAHRSHRKSLVMNANSPDVVLSKSKSVQLNLEVGKKKKMKRRVNVAIDGPSGSGKSTIAKLIAKKYSLDYINTGLVYRAIAYFAKSKNVSFDDEKKLASASSNLSIKLLKNEKVEINGKVVTKELRADDISQGASKVSTFSKIRKLAVLVQKKAALDPGIIMEGRDTTFVVMPKADVKIYLDTDSKTRAKRRTKQNENLGYETNYELILKEIEERDFRDKNRDNDPLHVTKDAHYIDASKMSIEDVIAAISKIINTKIEVKNHE